jgi:creatinine amidohydrolase/Fe(II)-dependent formamide hydrolase-like protein
VTASRSEPHIDALLMALTSDARTTVIDLFSLDLSPDRPGDPEPEHAGEIETSIMLHLRPDLVRTEAVHDAPPAERAVRRYVGGRPLTPPEASGGVIGHPSRASAARGAAILRSWLDDLVTMLDASPGGPPSPTTV